MPEAPSEKIAVRCACGTKLAVPASAVGRNAKCPKCGTVFPITAANPAPSGVGHSTQGHAVPAKRVASRAIPKPAAKPKAPASEDDETDSLLDALARQEATAEATSQPQSNVQTPCPKCKKMMPADATVCVACGYNVVTGRAIKVARTQPLAAVKAAKFAGRLSLGVALSGVGALLGAGIWFGVAVGGNVEIGWIAWGVGLLAGLGMKLGYGKESGFAGMVAGGMAVGGIVIAKVLIFAALFFAAAGGLVKIQRDILAEALEKEAAVATNGVAVGTNGTADVRERVSEMSDEEVQQRLAEYNEAHPMSAEEEDEATSGLLGAFFSTCFRPLDALFLLLAVGSAYKLASGGGDE